MYVCTTFGSYFPAGKNKLSCEKETWRTHSLPSNSEASLCIRVTRRLAQIAFASSTAELKRWAWSTRFLVISSSCHHMRCSVRSDCRERHVSSRIFISNRWKRRFPNASNVIGSPLLSWNESERRCRAWRWSASICGCSMSAKARLEQTEWGSN